MKKILFISAIFAIVFTSCDDSPALIFDGVKSNSSKHLGEGVWIDVPSFYKRAKSYAGFQAPNYESSIALQVDYATLSDVKKSFSKDVLRKKRTKLLKLETVLFGGVDSAVYTVVYDKIKNTIRYLLSIKKGNKMYGVKAFCQERLKDKYDLIIKNVLESVAFAEVVEKKEPFLIGRLISLTEYILTRDGKFPTESDDEAMINVKRVDVEDVGTMVNDKIDFLKAELRKHSTARFQDIKAERIGDGHYVSSSINEGENNVFGAYITDGEDMSNLFIGTCNNSVGLEEIADYVRTQNIKTVFDVRFD